MNKKRVLVTGAGALLGQGILRCMQTLRDAYYIVSCDPDFRATGHYLSDKAYVIPLAKEPDFLNAIEGIIAQEEIQLVFIGTDVELPTLSNRKVDLEKRHGVKIVVSSPRVIEIANDKWLTAKFLEDNGFPFPKTILADDKTAVDALIRAGSYPLFAKPRHGARSQGIRILKSESDLLQVMNAPGDLIIQEFLPESEGEYTAGCLVFQNECKATVVLKRDLRDGNTWRAYSDKSAKYDSFLKAVAERLQIDGPCNFQFRIKNNQPVIFEINSRFSGTTPLRMIFGFNEVKAVLDYYFHAISDYSFDIAEGAVLRVFSDIFVTSAQLEILQSKGCNERPECTEFPFLLQGQNSLSGK